MKEQLLNILQEFPGSKYRLLYFFEDYTWTLPSLLTEKRIENFCNDKSVANVQVFYPNGESIILEPLWKPNSLKS